MTIRSRLTLGYGLAFMLLVALAGLTVWWQLETGLRSAAEEALRIHAADVADDLLAGGTRVGALEPAEPAIFTALVAADGRIVDAGPGAPTALPALRDGASDRTLTDGGPRYAFFALPLPDGRTVVAGRSLAEVERSAARLPELFMVVGGVSALGSLLVGWWLAGRALAPIRRLTREADGIGPDELDRRLPVVRPTDELGRLATTLNRLLGRIERSVEHERAFIAGAAHDLRTPIADLRMRLDLLLVEGSREGRLDGSIGASLEAATHDARELGDFADALLRLAEAQTQGLDDAAADHVLPMLVARTTTDVEWLARERRVRIRESVDETEVRISAVRFQQALVNLLSNAVRHGPEDGDVELAVRATTIGDPARDVVLVEVADEGPGIDPELRERIFEPFASPRGGLTTHGLGLATAAAAVASQHGRIGLRARPDGGSVFWFWVPDQRQAGTARRTERSRGPATRSAGA